MELKVVEKTKNKLKFELKGEEHTFCNALRKELWNDEHVKAAGYYIEHSLFGGPVFTLETDGTDPKKVLSSAIKRLEKKNSELKEKIKKAL